MADKARHVISYQGRKFQNDYVFPAEIAALRARRTGQFQEKVILEQLKHEGEFLRRQGVTGDYLDVGAHIGNHSLFFAAFCPSKRVFAIEGHPTIRELLKGNLGPRNLDASERRKIRIIEAAAWSESNKRVQFAPIPRNNAGHTHIAGSGGRGKEKAEVEVLTIKIDDLAFDNLLVMKIDVEDTEHEVIAGALGTIKEHRPTIIIERHSQSQLDETLEQLKPFGYEVVHYWRGVHTYALKSA